MDNPVIYSCDFETIAINESLEKVRQNVNAYKTRVWLAGYMNWENTDEWGYFHNLHDFMQWVFSFTETTIFTFHNIEKFDQYFIRQYVERNNIPIKISSDGFKLFDKYIFIDTLKLMPMSIKSMGNSIGLPKGNTPIIYNYDYKANDDDINYLYNDIKIPILYGKKYGWVNLIFSGHHTLAGLAHKQMLVGVENNDFREGEQLVFKRRVQTPKLTKPYWAKSRSETEKLNKIIKPAYKGGVTRASGLFDISVEGSCYDVNSIYPSIYMGGVARNIDKIKTYVPNKDNIPNDSIIKIYIEAKIKDDCFQIIKRRSEIDRSYSDEIKGWYVITGYEYNYIIRTHDIRKLGVDIIITFKHDDELDSKIIKHVQYWVNEKTECKKNGDNAGYVYAKLMINSVYGYFGMFDKEYPIYKWVDGFRERTNTYRGGNPTCDLPCAIFITAMGRVKIGEAMNRIGVDKFIYCDTDSLHIVGDTDELDVDDYEIGWWKKEYEFRGGAWRKAKCYIENRVEDGWVSVVAGVSEQISIEEFSKEIINSSSRERLEIRGGCVIIEGRVQIS